MRGVGHMSTDLVVWVDPDEAARREREAERAAFEAQVDADLDLAAEMERAYELHAAGVGYRKIAQQLGVSRMRAYRFVQRHIQLHAPIADPGTYAAQHLAEIAMVRKKVVAEALLLPRAERPFTAAAVVLVKLQEREDRLTRREQRASVTVDEFEAMSDEELAAYAAA